MTRRYREDLSIDYWPGFTDALLSVILVMTFIVTLFVIAQSGLVDSLDSTQTELEEKRLALAALNDRLADFDLSLKHSTGAYQELQERYDIKKKQLDLVNLQMDETRSQIASLTRQLTATSASLSLANTQLTTRDNQARQSSEALTGALAQLQATSNTLIAAQEELVWTRMSLNETQEQLTLARAELTVAEEALVSEREKAESLADEVTVKASDIRELTNTVTDYMERIQRLSDQLSAVRENAEAKDASLNDLNASIEEFSRRVSELQAELDSSKLALKDKDLEVGKLLDLLEDRDRKIAELRNFSKYKSEFLARLADVFAGVENIKVIGDRFVFQGEVLFASGSAELTEEGKVELNKFADIYKSLEDQIPQSINLNIQIQGHTDIDPISSGRFKDNWELSAARSLRVLRYLSLRGIPERRMSSAGFSQYHPVVADDSPNAKAQNRRIEILITRR